MFSFFPKSALVVKRRGMARNSKEGEWSDGEEEPWEEEDEEEEEEEDDDFEEEEVPKKKAKNEASKASSSSNKTKTKSKSSSSLTATGHSSIEETYVKKTQLEHILLRPDTYIGSVEEQENTSLWVLDKPGLNMEYRPVSSFVPG